MAPAARVVGHYRCHTSSADPWKPQPCRGPFRRMNDVALLIAAPPARLELRPNRAIVADRSVEAHTVLTTPPSSLVHVPILEQPPRSFGSQSCSANVPHRAGSATAASRASPTPTAMKTRKQTPMTARKTACPSRRTLVSNRSPFARPQYRTLATLHRNGPAGDRRRD